MQEDDTFGHWLAGFIDGEGCFLIETTRPSATHYCAFRLEVRADDRPILDEIRERLGIGKIRECRRGTYHGAIWAVQNKADCASLVGFLDRYPLRAKKARDYAVWREAVAEWGCVSHGGGRGVNMRRHDWTRMAELRVALRDGRRAPAAGVVG